MKLNIYKQFKNAYPRDEKFTGSYEGNWLLHQKNFLKLCQAYEVVPTAIPRLFRGTIAGSALTLFDSHFSINAMEWTLVDALFMSRFDSQAKKEDVSDNLDSLRIETFRK